MSDKAKARAYFSAVSAYDVAAVEAMVHEDYIQHNPFVATGRSAFIALLPKLEEHNSKIENLRILQDGSHIVMHHLWKNATPFGANEMVAFHIIRFNNEGLIAEHWNVMAESARPNQSLRSMIDGETVIKDLDKTDENKAIVVSLFEQLTTKPNGGHEVIFPDFFQPDFHQHNPDVADGIKGLSEALESGALELGYTKLHKVFAEGNFVLSISEGSQRGVSSVFYDLLRLENGKICEHWSIVQNIPTENLANENTMFNF